MKKWKIKKLHFIHCGCKVNQYETNAMIQQFVTNGYELVDFDKYADVYVINTCTVTNMADRKSRQIIRRTKQINEKSILVVTGCYAQVAHKEIEKIKEINIIIGNTEKREIYNLVENYKNGLTKKVSDINKEKLFTDFGTITFTEKTRAVIKVQDGCNNFCSYCLIPYAKGRIRSRKMENVLNEVKKIASEGIKEVVITGIHVASYGKDLDENISLIDLLEKINQVEGIERIRLGSLEPKIITEEFTYRLGKLEKICDHFHLSLQSGCDSTLKRMNRKYTTKEFENCVNILRKMFNNVAITTDVIVGFPGETDEEFNITYDFLKKINFSKIHVFKYSPRKGTVAEKMENQIDEKTKEERSKKLIELSKKCEKYFIEKFVGKDLEILFEEKKDGKWQGHTKNYIMVKTKNNATKNLIKIIKNVSNDDISISSNV